MPNHSFRGNAIVLKISKAALLAATLSLSAVPAIGIAGAMAQDTTTAAPALQSELTIPTITAVDSSMDEAALRDVLTGNVGPHASELAALTATSITIPEIDLSMTTTPTGGATQTSKVVYKDLVLNNVKNGIAESASVGSSSTASPEGTFSFGKLSADAVDFGAILALYSVAPAGSTSTDMKPIYKNFAFEGGSFDGSGTKCSFGKVSGDEFDARPLKVSFGQLVDAANKLNAAGANAKPTPADITTFVTFMTDVFQAFKSTPLTMAGLNCDGSADGKAFKFSVGSLGMDGYAPGIYPALNINDISFSDDGQDSFTLKSASFKSIDLHAPIAAVEAAGSDIDEAWFNANYRKLIPSWAGFSLSGLSFNLPGESAARVQASIADFDLTLSDYLNGIPTKISTKASGVDVPLPDNSTDDSIKMLKAVGITRLNMNYEVSAAWDQASNAINLDKVSISGNDLGTVALAAVVGNATEQLFDADPNTEMAASMAVTLKNVKLDVTDAGLGDKLVPLAAPQGTDPAAFRAQLAGQAEGLAIAMLGSTDQARALGTALSDFVKGDKKALTLNVASKDPAGLPAQVLMQASEDPTILAPQVDITGSAQ